jgi:hypothetical protein
LIERVGMPALCQKQTHAPQQLCHHYWIADCWQKFVSAAHSHPRLFSFATEHQDEIVLSRQGHLPHTKRRGVKKIVPLADGRRFCRVTYGRAAGTWKCPFAFLFRISVSLQRDFSTKGSLYKGRFLAPVLFCVAVGSCCLVPSSRC